MSIKIVDGVRFEMTAEEIAELKNRDSNPEVKAEQVRSERDALLRKTDWTALSDTTMSAEMAAYRQALRDITDQEGFPYEVIWPVKP